MSILLVALLPLTIAFSWIRLYGYGSHQFEGTPIGGMRLPFLARLFMHAVPVAISLVTAVLLAAFNVISWTGIVAPIVSGAVLVLLPLRYTLSEKGIRRTFGAFRRWTEFAGVERAPGGARLKPLRKAPPAHVWLSGSRGDDDFLQLLRTLIKNAYKGKTNVPVFPGTPTPSSAEQGIEKHADTPGIAAFQRGKTS